MIIFFGNKLSFGNYFNSSCPIRVRSTHRDFFFQVSNVYYMQAGSRRCSIARGGEYLFLKYDFKAQKIARIICHYLPCCPREGINPRELMPPFTILAARLFLSPPLPPYAPKTKNHDRDELCKTKVIVYKSRSELFLLNKKRD